MADWILPKRRKMMNIIDFIGYVLFVGIVIISIDHTQQALAAKNKLPAYSLQNMPKTDFSCRGKILGGYYADADTQCQMFHICVKIAGVGVQDFRFLCPNGTAFDQEAQTCADFGDVDCEQATLFYGSDNFDLYRIGSGYDTPKRPPTPPATEDESTFHLQRAESNDIRRSKQNNIAAQNALYNQLGSSSQSQSSSSPSQHQPRQQHHQKSEITSLKPANQYQTPKVTTTPAAAAAASSSAATAYPSSSPSSPPRYSEINRQINRKPAAQVTAKPTPFVLASPSSSSSNSNNNDEIFKGSHSSNFYSNRNSNDDDDDYKRASITNTAAAKSRHRSRGRTHYRGTPASITSSSSFGTSTTTTTSTTTRRPHVAFSIQNYSTFTPFTTTTSPFKFTYSSTVRSQSPSASSASSANLLSNVGNNYQQNQINSTPLGPLQQQYQQTNYNTINYRATASSATASSPSSTTTISTTPPIITTLRNSYRPHINLITTTPSTFGAVPLQRQVVSVPTPFNTNHLNNNHNHNNANGKLLINTNSNNNNNHAFNSQNNFFASTSNATANRQQRIFDNHNVINNYQTTSPFANPRAVVENHLPANNTILRPAQSIANHYFPQNSVAATNGNFNNNNNNNHSQRNSSFYQPNFGFPSVASVAPAVTQTTTTTTHLPVTRNGVAVERPNFNQQDLINQFNSKQQQKSSPSTAGSTATVNNRRTEAKDYRLQLHYDINDYLTTDKYTARSYSPTSEQYRSAQLLSSTPSQSAAVQFFTTTTPKYYDSVFSSNPSTPKTFVKFDTHNQYQTQQDRPAQNSAFKFNNNSPINTTPQPVLAKQQQQQQQQQQSNLNNNYNFNSNANNNNISPASTKKFSTLVPKGNYAPTTFKPAYYFNVAKQINDNLSTPGKLRTATDSIDRFGSASSASSLITTTASSTTSTTARSAPIQPIFNRGPDFAHFKFAEAATAPVVNRPAASLSSSNGQYYQQPQQQQKHHQQQHQPPQQPFVIKPTANVSAIDENDGQYHPELYEKDFARYKIKNRKKQQQHRSNQEQRQQQQHRQQLHKQPNNFGKAQNDFGLASNKYQQQQQPQQQQQQLNFNSRGTQKSFNNNNNNNNNGGGNAVSSIEEEFLTAAHSQNIAASGNELWAHSKNAASSPSAAIKSKSQSYNFPSSTKVPTIATTARPTATTTIKAIKPAPFASSASRDDKDKDASYDYAYYDSGNDTPHDYSDIELDFTKTRKQ